MSHLPRRKQTWSTAADTEAARMRYSDYRDLSRPNSRASFGGLPTTPLNILSEVKEVPTPTQSPTNGNAYEKFEMVTVHGNRSAHDATGLRDFIGGDHHMELKSFREADTESLNPSTVSTMLSGKEEGVYSFAPMNVGFEDTVFGMETAGQSAKSPVSPPPPDGSIDRRF